MLHRAPDALVAPRRGEAQNASRARALENYLRNRDAYVSYGALDDERKRRGCK